jgi:para-aminobenzoate synthetase component 1
VDPLRILRLAQGRVTIDGVYTPGDPLDLLKRELAAHKRAPISSKLAFTGGAVGFFGYGMGAVSRHGDADGVPDMVVGFYDIVLGFDHRARCAWLVQGDRPECAEALLERLKRPRGAMALPRLEWQPDLARNVYEARVERVREYIRAGDISQANFTARHTALRPATLDLPSLYLALRRANPAPFAAYLNYGEELTLLSASPERFLSLGAEGEIETRPIKGTRPRHADPARDAALADELVHSIKDRAENLMIVDLLRNDIGRVAEIGSIKVPELCRVESFARVHHLVSSIKGRLKPEFGAVDLLRSAFPGGSITGAPKIRAMQIIDELEACRRGPYCGAIAWIGFDGAMDSSIIIRTIVATPGQLAMQAGGGIVADSEAATEYDEMVTKAAPFLEISDG